MPRCLLHFHADSFHAVHARLIISLIACTASIESPGNATGSFHSARAAATRWCWVYVSGSIDDCADLDAFIMLSCACALMAWWLARSWRSLYDALVSVAYSSPFNEDEVDNAEDVDLEDDSPRQGATRFSQVTAPSEACCCGALSMSSRSAARH